MQEGLQATYMKFKCIFGQRQNQCLLLKIEIPKTCFLGGAKPGVRYLLSPLTHTGVAAGGGN